MQGREGTSSTDGPSVGDNRHDSGVIVLFYGTVLLLTGPEEKGLVQLLGLVNHWQP